MAAKVQTIWQNANQKLSFFATCANLAKENCVRAQENLLKRDRDHVFFISLRDKSFTLKLSVYEKFYLYNKYCCVGVA